MNKPQKRNKLQEILKACEILQDDSDKIQLVVEYITKQLYINVKKTQYPSIEKEDTLKFLFALNITPKETHPLPICESTLDILVDCYYQFIDTDSIKDLSESFEKAAKHLSESTKQRVRAHHIFSLVSSLQRLDSMQRKDLGEIVVSSAISSLLDVICCIKGHVQNG
ncbi:predicted protein [Naegleria gruberi]|uniref:Predicted protein n=1 Tax=Naegleria gruberi TaxID=5762 RepID=D2W5P3_NAEGR|nr:uncharacterized protein NAEGRDRAFT_76734 [Naegleria gruberi]EFC35609.1 predicted protein [Naegleria gruberi]|eukprot:XP_002668353.1 predicted protein [Naegleria gruberi strain NEG-M]